MPAPVKDFVRPTGLVALLFGEGEEFRQGSRPALFFAFFATFNCVLSAHLFQLTFSLRQLTLGLDRKLMPAHGANGLRLESSEAHWALPH